MPSQHFSAARGRLRPHGLAHGREGQARHAMSLLTPDFRDQISQIHDAQGTTKIRVTFFCRGSVEGLLRVNFSSKFGVKSGVNSEGAFIADDF